MKNYIQKLLFISFCVFTALNINAQTQGELRDYHRNSLATMMVYHSEDTFGIEIYNAFQAIPMPDKYDDHTLSKRVIFNDSISGVLRKKNGLIKAKYGKTLNNSEILKNAKALEKLLNNAQCGNMLVAKWFNLQGDNIGNATFSMDTIKVRGQYDASDVDVALAKQTARGMATLSDAGEELLTNTYILVNDMTYVTAEEKAAVAKVVVSVLGGILDGLTGGNTGANMAKTAGAIADSYTGFTVKTHSYLFQLQWNDELMEEFLTKYYTETPDEDKILAFLTDTNSFKVKYVAHKYELDGKSELKGKYPREELVKMSCTRSMDKNIAALQLAYEDFKVKTPIYSVETNNKGKIVAYTAKIGLKEGISEKSTFQVVRKYVDPETSRTKYRVVATLKPIKGKIWDNRYNAVLEQDKGSDLGYTSFKKVSGGEILPGMLIIEGKYRKAQ